LLQLPPIRSLDRDSHIKGRASTARGPGRCHPPTHPAAICPRLSNLRHPSPRPKSFLSPVLPCSPPFFSESPRLRHPVCYTPLNQSTPVWLRYVRPLFLTGKRPALRARGGAYGHGPRRRRAPGGGPG
jgi:hypothetical protein